MTATSSSPNGSSFTTTWINLHHVLFELARNVPERPAGDRRRPVDVQERTQLARLTESEQQAWSRAVGFYRERLVQRDVAFDRKLIALRGEMDSLACSADRPASDRTVAV